MGDDRRAVRETSRAHKVVAAALTTGALFVAPIGATLAVSGTAHAKPYVCNLNGACNFGDDKEPAEPDKPSASKHKLKFPVYGYDKESNSFKPAGKLVVKIGPGIKFKFKPIKPGPETPGG